MTTIGRPLPPPSPRPDSMPPAWRDGWPWSTPDDRAPTRSEPATDWPRITIVTPSYNQAPFIEATIRSVLLQGYPNLEYIVVDGGSSDGTPALIEKYHDHLTWWVSERDRGQSHALNKGFANATGELFGYLNSDDILEPDALFVCAEAFRNGAPWVVGNVNYWDADGRLMSFPEIPGRGLPRWLFSCPVGQPGSFWAAALHRRAGPFREDLRYVMDYEFWLRLRVNERVRPTRLDLPIARYRLHESSKTVGEGVAFGDEARSMVAPYIERLTWWERAWVLAARRRRMAHVRGREAIALLRRGTVAPAAGKLLAAVAIWPLIVADPAVFTGVRALLGRTDTDPSEESPFPPYW